MKCCFSAIEGKLYAVGGRNAAGELSTVECYNPQRNEWCFVEKMQEPHYGHAGRLQMKVFAQCRAQDQTTHQIIVLVLPDPKQKQFWWHSSLESLCKSFSNWFIVLSKFGRVSLKYKNKVHCNLLASANKRCIQIAKNLNIKFTFMLLRLGANTLTVSSELHLG